MSNHFADLLSASAFTALLGRACAGLRTLDAMRTSLDKARLARFVEQAAASRVSTSGK
jgi:hypothetical protein